ncbi:hypothetical protein E3Q24_01469 [Wallemia mellicola]|nr:hypothetical protein E3Q24_01469 [Wallemia mellicola]
MKDEDLAEFRIKCKEYYKTRSNDIQPVDAYFIQALPEERANLTKIQNDIRRQYHNSVAVEKKEFLRTIKDNTQSVSSDYRIALNGLKEFIDKHGTNNPGIEIFLISLYNFLRLQRNHKQRLCWVIDDGVFTEYGLDAYKLLIRKIGLNLQIEDNEKCTYIMATNFTNSELSALSRQFPSKIKRSRRILQAVATSDEAEQGVRNINKLATGRVHISTQDREEGYESSLITELYNYFLDLIF